jgi:hypothetical protein
MERLNFLLVSERQAFVEVLRLMGFQALAESALA